MMDRQHRSVNNNSIIYIVTLIHMYINHFEYHNILFTKGSRDSIFKDAEYTSGTPPLLANSARCSMTTLEQEVWTSFSIYPLNFISNVCVSDEYPARREASFKKVDTSRIG
ncbi:hypothetical protein HanXRQr2_Chr04g0174191 [Helianthus annuus]|uniref:Uncharacterized protein n=1 Tax=Helianthus annuus TaxID=4232 RepID=A0A9K3J8N7_HELAN|nr:hypothetical protein HanXRQr2_Chr04g0174191 [Helianthus annuus]KAJ0589575.1 hypothetical protein HanIR_Chr04g0187781 [Helianthus annuus]KAJ0931944.1 hypothetical protein HanPSC8_Chr04g0167841 [Helianthus annuus]